MSTDEIAREAARLIRERRAKSVDEAIGLVVDGLDAGSKHHLRLPAHGRVREHVRGFAMQAMGAEAYRESVRDVLRIAEEVMTILEAYDPVLAGRAAKGQVDADAALHVRIYTDADITDLAATLVDHEYQEPTFDTITTRWGRLNRIRFEEQGVQVVVTRCRPEMRDHPDANLHEDGRVEIVDLPTLRRQLS